MRSWQKREGKKSGVKLPAAAMRAFCFLIFPPFILTRGKREREREKEKKPIYFSLFSFIFQEEVKRVWFHGPVCCRCRCFCCCCWMHLTNVEGPFLFWTLSAADCNGSPVSRRRRRREVLRLPEAPSFQLSTLVSIFSLFLYFSFSFSLSLSLFLSLSLSFSLFLSLSLSPFCC